MTTDAATGSAAARRGRPGYDRDRLLAVVVQAFNDHGYEATSLGMLSERLGLSRSAIYHHFDSKEQMLEVALAQALDGLEAVFDEPAATSGPADARIRHVLRGAVLVLTAELPSVTLLLRLRGNTEVERAALARRRAIDARLRALFELARDEGTLRPEVDPRLAERLTFGMVNSLVEWYRPDGRTSPEALAEAVLAYVDAGLTAR